MNEKRLRRSAVGGEVTLGSYFQGSSAVASGDLHPLAALDTRGPSSYHCATGEKRRAEQMCPLEFQTPDPAPSRSPGTYSTYQTFFLRRLRRLLRVGRDLGTSLPSDDWRLKLLRRSVYATYYECFEQGVAEEARQLLDQSSRN